MAGRLRAAVARPASAVRTAASALASAVAAAVPAVARSVLAATVTAFAAPPPERPWPLRSRGRRGRRPRDRVWLLDAVLAFVVTVTTAAAYAEPNVAVGGMYSDQLLLLASVAVGLPLLVRDRWPLAAWRATVAVAFLSAGLFSPLFPQAPLLPTHLLAILVTSYSAVVRAERPIALGALVVTMVGVAALPVPAADGAAAFTPGGWVALVLGLSAPIVLGHNVRVRRRTQAALAAEQRRGEEVRAERAVLEERSRIARELHDVVAHHMTHIAIQAEAAPLRSPDDAAALADDLTAIRGTALSALTETRRILGVLRDDSRDGGVPPPAPGLAQLDELAAAARGAGHEVTVDVGVGDGEVTPGIALSVHRIVQESLSNVVRHAPGAAVAVVVGWAGPSTDELHVRVSNGPPTATSPPAAELGGGHGLVGMRERVAMLDGRLRTGQTADGGYLVDVLLPVGSA